MMRQRLRGLVVRIGRPLYRRLYERVEADLRVEALREELAERTRRITRLEARLQNDHAIARRLAALEDAVRAFEEDRDGAAGRAEPPARGSA